MTERLAVWSSRRPWLTLAGWALALVAAIAISAAFLGDALSGDEEVTSDTESRRADELAFERFADGAGPARARRHRGGGRSLRRRRRSMSRASSGGCEGLAAELRRSGCDSRSPPSTTRASGGWSRGIAMPRGCSWPSAAMPRTTSRASSTRCRAPTVERGFDAAITGEFTLDADFSTLAEEDLRNGELGFGLPAALIVLLIVFGSVVAGLIPMLLAIVSIVVALALAALVGQAFPLSVFATNMLTGMGLALGIDYSLFVLSRYREERLHGREKLRRDRRRRRHGQPRGAVQRHRLHARHGRAAAGAAHDHAKPRRRRDRGRAGLGRRRADAAAGAPGPARGSRQRAAHPVLRANRGPRAESVLVSHGASGDEAAAHQPRARHRDPARHGRAGACACDRARPA